MKSNEFKVKIKDLNDKIQELKTNFYNNFFKINTTVQLNNRIDKKLNSLKKLQNDFITLKTSNNTTLTVSRKTVFNCFYFNLLQSEVEANPNSDQYFVEYTEDLVLSLLDIIQAFQKDRPEILPINIEIKNSSKKEALLSIVEMYFPQHHDEIMKKLVFFNGASLFYGSWNEPVKFDPLKKGTGIILSNDNKTATHSYGDSHTTVLAKDGYTDGSIKWTIKVDNKGTTNWLCIGIMEYTNNMTFGDHQSNANAINIRGGEYECNNMNPSRISNLEENDIIVCTLDFNEDIFKISCAGKFEVKSTKQVKGKKWYPMVILYYANQAVSFIHE